MPQNRMPGSFPSSSVSAPGSHGLGDVAALGEGSNVAEILIQGQQKAFESSEVATSKSLAQKHFIGQLDTLTYFFIGFQFVRYTHCSCLPPTLLHCIVQLSLHGRRFTSTSPISNRRIYSNYLDAQQHQLDAAFLPFDRRNMNNFLASKTRLLVFWNFVVALVYHTLLTMLYFRPLANDGKLSLLDSGSWYFLSFLGERLPTNYLSSEPALLQLWKLGYFGLIGLNLAILVLQLVLYQSIFLQSTISPIGLRLSEHENYILRLQGEGSGEEVTRDENGVPDILDVKLYESFDRNSFLSFQ